MAELSDDGLNLLRETLSMTPREFGYCEANLSGIDIELNKWSLIVNIPFKGKPLIFSLEAKGQEEFIAKVFDKTTNDSNIKKLCYEYSILKYLEKAKSGVHQKAIKWISTQTFIGFISQPVGRLLILKSTNTGILSWIG